MAEYSWTKGLVKGLYFAAAVAAGVAAAVHELGGLDDVSKLTLPAVAAAIFLAVRVAANWLKVHYPDAAALKWLPVLVAAMLVSGILGCATNGGRFTERTTSPDGTVTETVYHQRSVVTLGSKLAEGSGDMDYQADDADGESWSLKIGNATMDASAGDGADIIRAILALGQALATPSATPEAVAP